MGHVCKVQVTSTQEGIRQASKEGWGEMLQVLSSQSATILVTGNAKENTAKRVNKNMDVEEQLDDSMLCKYK